jgi:hypothetical protein
LLRPIAEFVALSRAGFSASFFLAVMKAIDRDTVHLADL